MFVPTRSSLLKSHDEKKCETVVFENKKPKKVSENKMAVVDSDKKLISSKGKLNKEKKNKDNLTMKKLRYDIIKFGTSGFSGAKKEESKVALAVSLGAVPPKRKYLNYKELLHCSSSSTINRTSLESVQLQAIADKIQ
ncbi:conserved hypothetical protein [Pediculus humanus corporis]|uniref:Uncharacterized protein n=1 Tax=Pediculus humanus subsp. corporis TaxID=121224 RepID=E0VHK6_PEDHC|nr:uncharacterized protein Phum_PHUM212690 [Pediculus humanus corporis]EEB12892.1 conserved hypothetical protein [Pediculus humanus corporis]